MLNSELVLGIDTSNYTTSLALTDCDKRIVNDSRRPLIVKQGERGLRQSHALFQHMENLPEMIVNLFGEVDRNSIKAIAVSNKPRPIEGSYMPVFKAGVNYGKVLAASLGVPLFDFSHQEGHIEAAAYQSFLTDENDYLAYHLSGGTSELLYVKDQTYKIIGGSKDISFGQVLDRVGVAMNLEFPAGKTMDRLASMVEEKKEPDRANKQLLKKIPLDGLYINLSGIETQCRRALENTDNFDGLIYELFIRISECLCKLTERAVIDTGCKRVLFSGGVSASRFIRSKLISHFNSRDILLVFGDPALSSDNAVGISLLGGKNIWL